MGGFCLTGVLKHAQTAFHHAEHYAYIWRETFRTFRLSGNQVPFVTGPGKHPDHLSPPQTLQTIIT